MAKWHLDLGCGSAPRTQEGYDSFGVDIARVTNERVHQADLAISRIPADNDMFDLVTAYDFMEHIPSFVYVPVYSGGTIFPSVTPVKRNSMIELFNEIYRVLKPGGEFYMVSPCYPHQGVFQDPTHVFFWTPESLHYFTGDYYGFHDHYGHTSKFELLEHHVDVLGRLHGRMRAIKPAEPPYEVGAVI